ncbi:MAG TPA: hypothetical protein VLE49_10845 [Anaerolineales bacterium]|nr:hypothetical protein [Anaerolineales bacterium]
MPSVLFVCTGNRCRSPLAAAIFWNRLCAWGRTEGWRVDSAGTWTQPGLPADPLAQKAAQEIGLDLRNHRTHSIDQFALNEYDLIVVMEKSHKEVLDAELSEYAGKICLLTHLAGEIEDVPDPSAENYSSHMQIAKELLKLINTAYADICGLAVTWASSLM